MSSLMTRSCYLEKVTLLIEQVCRRDIDSNCLCNNYGVTKLHVLH